MKKTTTQNLKQTNTKLTMPFVARAHAHTHARTHARMHARTHARTHTRALFRRAAFVVVLEPVKQTNSLTDC